MALINDLYVFVDKEDVNRGIDTVTHPVEEGIDITDHVRRNPISISLSGEIVGESAADILSQIAQIHSTGAMVSYVGRNTMKNAQIVKFDTGHPKTIWGGCSFTMEIKEVRVAKSAYVEDNVTVTKTKATTSAGTQQKQTNSTAKKAYHTVKSGETAWYIGEKLYKAQGSSLDFIVKNNPDAPKVKGDWTTLQVGTKLYVYDKK